MTITSSNGDSGFFSFRTAFKAHSALHSWILIAVVGSETTKVVWNSMCFDGTGYWWMRADGFSMEGSGSGLLIEAGCVLTLFILLLDAVLMVLRVSVGTVAALCLHVLVAFALSVLALADAALVVGGGGARVSLPLVLFVIGEPAYVFSVVRPWLHLIAVGFLVACFTAVACVLATVAVFARAAAALPCQSLSQCAAFQVMVARSSFLRAVLFAMSFQCVWISRLDCEKSPGDLLSQLAIDAASISSGVVPASDQYADIAEHRAEISGESITKLPILLFHWEAAGAALLDHIAAAAGRGHPRHGAQNCSRTATPFLCGLLSSRSEDVPLASAFVQVPMTLKTAWEVLCGIPPAMTSDFREQGSTLRRQCLPRLLKRCCGYWSILAKTDHELPELPRRVFGFDETIIHRDSGQLLVLLRKRLDELGALGPFTEGRQTPPVLVYYYSDEAHAPYTLDRMPPGSTKVATSAQDVFFEMHSQTDEVARRLSEFWPPPMRRNNSVEEFSGGGLSVYFGDHGENIYSDSPIPHGQGVSRDEAEIMLVSVDGTFGATPSFSSYTATARRQRSVGLRRPADIFATITERLGIRISGRLHVGKSLHRNGHRALSTFSFYRPSDRVSVHVVDEHESAVSAVQSTSFHRSLSGWIVDADKHARYVHGSDHSVSGIVGCDSTVGNGRCTDEPCIVADTKRCRRTESSDSCQDKGQLQRLCIDAETFLTSALVARDDVNRLLTASNVYAAWCISRLELAARQAAVAARSLLAILTGALLPER
eukprot:TRINITY_DN26017_c0_g1_i1.p1 TRINITY_DN26017_c0_g1~~TRINITY_DN26017_c0_g1_i1.p1  ORF type:complete len:769 (-),score=107.00 TRINITY_DN26017_c0_g1_i1:236-2542(-)